MFSKASTFEKPHAGLFALMSDSLDELSHVLTQCFTARPLALPVAVEWMGAGVLLVTAGRHTHAHNNTKSDEIKLPGLKRAMCICADHKCAANTDCCSGSGTAPGM